MLTPFEGSVDMKFLSRELCGLIMNPLLALLILREQNESALTNT